MLWNDIIGLTKAKFVSEHAQLVIVWPTLQNALLLDWSISWQLSHYLLFLILYASYSVMP